VIAYIGDNEPMLRLVLTVVGSSERMRLRGALRAGTDPAVMGIPSTVRALAVSVIEDLERETMRTCRVEARE
jgi:hypothetical protein